MSQEATLRLFNAIQVESKGNGEASQKKQSFFERTIPFGYILDPTIESIDEDTLKIIEATVGISAEQANAAFHKSWKTIQEKSIETLVCQQLLHYLTTYGFEALGVYNADTVYIPNEKLEIPELQDDVPLRVIKAMDASDILEGIIQLASGAALSERVLQDIMTIIQVNSFESNQLVMDIQNRELKARLYKYYDIVPDEPVEYLRHLIGKLTGESLVIKNDALIQKLKAADRPGTTARISAGRTCPRSASGPRAKGFGIHLSAIQAIIFGHEVHFSQENLFQSASQESSHYAQSTSRRLSEQCYHSTQARNP